MGRYTRLKGVSLIELMIVIAILGVLAAISIPSYQHYVTKARSAEVFSKFDYLKTAAIEWKETSAAPNFDGYGTSFSQQVTNQNFNWGWAEGNGVLFASYIPNTVVLLTFGGQVNTDGSVTWACLSDDLQLSNCFTNWSDFANAVPDAASLD